MSGTSEDLSDVLRQMADPSEATEPTIDQDVQPAPIHSVEPRSIEDPAAALAEAAAGEAPTPEESLAEEVAGANDTNTLVAEVDAENDTDDQTDEPEAEAVSEEEDFFVAEEPDDEAEEEAPAFDVNTAPHTASEEIMHDRLVSRKMRKQSTTDMKAFFTPIIITLGALLLAPGIWAVMILAGRIEVVEGDESTRTVAMIMLASWPISLFLIVSGVIFAIQVSREKKAREAERAAMRAR
jgi:hypothetical protein